MVDLNEFIDREDARDYIQMLYDEGDINESEYKSLCIEVDEWDFDEDDDDYDDDDFEDDDWA